MLRLVIMCSCWPASLDQETCMKGPASASLFCSMNRRLMGRRKGGLLHPKQPFTWRLLRVTPSLPWLLLDGSIQQDHTEI